MCKPAKRKHFANNVKRDNTCFIYRKPPLAQNPIFGQNEADVAFHFWWDAEEDSTHSYVWTPQQNRWMKLDTMPYLGSKVRENRRWEIRIKTKRKGRDAMQRVMNFKTECNCKRKRVEEVEIQRMNHVIRERNCGIQYEAMITNLPFQWLQERSFLVLG